MYINKKHQQLLLLLKRCTIQIKTLISTNLPNYKPRRSMDDPKAEGVPSGKPDPVQQHRYDRRREGIIWGLTQNGPRRCVSLLNFRRGRRFRNGNALMRVAVHQIAEERRTKGRVRHQVRRQVIIVFLRNSCHDWRLDSCYFADARTA